MAGPSGHVAVHLNACNACGRAFHVQGAQLQRRRREVRKRLSEGPLDWVEKARKTSEDPDLSDKVFTLCFCQRLDTLGHKSNTVKFYASRSCTNAFEPQLGGASLKEYLTSLAKGLGPPSAGTVGRQFHMVQLYESEITVLKAQITSLVEQKNALAERISALSREHDPLTAENQQLRQQSPTFHNGTAMNADFSIDDMDFNFEWLPVAVSDDSARDGQRGRHAILVPVIETERMRSLMQGLILPLCL